MWEEIPWPRGPYACASAIRVSQAGEQPQSCDAAIFVDTTARYLHALSSIMPFTKTIFATVTKNYTKMSLQFEHPRVHSYHFVSEELSSSANQIRPKRGPLTLQCFLLHYERPSPFAMTQLLHFLQQQLDERRHSLPTWKDLTLLPLTAATNIPLIFMTMADRTNHRDKLQE